MLRTMHIVTTVPWDFRKQATRQRSGRERKAVNLMETQGPRHQVEFRISVILGVKVCLEINGYTSDDACLI
jgi:hypothetical protein